jgi:hypothetical protein
MSGRIEYSIVGTVSTSPDGTSGDKFVAPNSYH